jgi:hemolysin activation/secretion protein
MLADKVCGRAVSIGMLMLGCCGCPTIMAQGLVESAGSQRPLLPPFEPQPLVPGSTLPSISFAPSATGDAVASGSLYVRRVTVRGNTVLPGEAIAAITAPYVDRQVSFDELLQLRDKLTLAYVDRGYVTSGAAVNSQSVNAGELMIDLTEGAVSDITVHTDGRYRVARLRAAVAGFGPLAPANVIDIEQRLRVLQQDSQIRRIDGQLLPTGTPGQSLLALQVSERSPWRRSVEFSNYQSPAVGATRANAELGYLNLTGRGDRLLVGAQRSAGLRGYSLEYSTPLNVLDSRLAVVVRSANSDIVEAPFAHLDIRADTRTYGLTLSRPIIRTLSTRATVSITGERRHSQSFLLGSGFSFTPGLIEGRADLSVVRAGTDYVRRGKSRVLAGRLSLSAGQKGQLPESHFLALLGQLQWGQRLTWRDSQLVGRVDLQLSDSALPGMEQLAIGGHSTVRGYRENTLVRDAGVLASFEARVPLLKRPTEQSILELAPFVDLSRSWNRHREAPGPAALGSLGIGLRWWPWPAVRVEAYKGWAINRLNFSPGSDWQDHGIHVGIVYEEPQ